MKANELMIGDWVYNHRKWECPIVEIHKDSAVVIARHYGEEEFELSDLYPIPLTPEILEKNGWTYNDGNEKFQPKTWSGNGIMLKKEIDCFRIVVVSDYDDEDTNDTPFLLRYVSDLQHALKLRGKDKEIVI